ncbi:hypothetical protein J6590_003620 [Homalodisca vitripennis]|nr:hypothetical protein J6590_003620 [Homalodisca vitripennis]
MKIQTCVGVVVVVDEEGGNWGESDDRISGYKTNRDRPGADNSVNIGLTVPSVFCDNAQRYNRSALIDQPHKTDPHYYMAIVHVNRHGRNKMAAKRRKRERAFFIVGSF